jgi:hypothetical protein
MDDKWCFGAERHAASMNYGNEMNPTIPELVQMLIDLLDQHGEQS